MYGDGGFLLYNGDALYYINSKISFKIAERMSFNNYIFSAIFHRYAFDTQITW